MFSRVTICLKQFATAISLLLLLLVTLEIGLRAKLPPVVDTIAVTASSPEQKWLTASATVHHELRRLSELSLPDGPTFETNSLGFRGTERGNPTSAHDIRILVLGDQTILGPELQEKHTVPVRLREFLSKVTGTSIEVLNGGTPGYCPLLCLLRYSSELTTLQPDIVIVHFDMSDVTDDTAYRRHLRTSGNQRICQNIRTRTERSSDNQLMQMTGQSALVRYLKMKAGFESSLNSPLSFQGRYQWTFLNPPDLRLNIQHALHPIREWQQVAARNGFQLLVSCSPVPWQVASAAKFPDLATRMPNSDAWPVADDVPFQLLQAVCEKLDVPLCSAVHAFRSYPESSELFAPSAASLSAYGAALYARELASMLLSTQPFANSFTPRTDLTSSPHLTY